MNVERECGWCGSRFTADRRTARFCSTRCRTDARIERDKASNTGPWKPRPGVCAHCGSPYTRRQARALYCSHRCRLDARADRRANSGWRQPRPCARCGTEFNPNSPTHKYCSPDCVRRTLPVDIDGPWQTRAACLGTALDLWFPVPETGRRVDRAVAICGVCTVRTQCLDFAQSSYIPHGIFGGLTARQRRTRRKAAA